MDRIMTKEIEETLLHKALSSFVNADIQNPKPEEIKALHDMLKSAWLNQEYELED